MEEDTATHEGRFASPIGSIVSFVVKVLSSQSESNKKCNVYSYNVSGSVTAVTITAYQPLTTIQKDNTYYFYDLELVEYGNERSLKYLASSLYDVLNTEGEKLGEMEC